MRLVTKQKTTSCPSCENKKHSPFIQKQIKPSIQPKLKIGRPNDKYEHEADVMAARVMRKPMGSEGAVMEKTEQEGVQLKCSACEEGIQTKSSVTTPADHAPSGLESKISASRGNGFALSSSVNRSMSRSFGHDFSNVRIHTNSGAHDMNNQLNSRAFTYGSDIYFNKGEYNPTLSTGKELLAHELTHTIQQSSQTSSETRIQKKETETFSPQYVSAWATHHDEILVELAKANRARNKFFEVKIPGAIRTGKAEGRAGRADFYEATRPIALIFKEGIPMFLGAHKEFYHKGENDKSPQREKGAPIAGPSGRGNNKFLPKHIYRLDKAPKNIKLGDLKPAGKAEQILGQSQISSYMGGISDTRDEIYSYLKDNPDKGNPKLRKKQEGINFPNWSPNLGYMSSLKIPKYRRITNKSGPLQPLGLYDDAKNSAYDTIKGLEGKPIVYKHPQHKGIWVYEFIPIKFPSNIKEVKKSKVFENALQRLEELKQSLRSKSKKSTKKKTGGKGSIINRKIKKLSPNKNFGAGSVKRSLQLKKKKEYDPIKWKKDYQEWKKQISGITGTPLKKSKSSGKTGQAFKLLGALSSLKKRHGNNVSVPIKTTSLHKAAKNFKQLQHWAFFGHIYGKLRETFGSIYLKIESIIDRIKSRISNPDKVNKKPKFRSSTFGTVLKTTFDIVVQFLKSTIKTVHSNITNTLISGSKKLLNQLFSDTIFKKYQDKIDPLQNKVNLWTSLPRQLETNFKNKFSKQIEIYEGGQKFADKIKAGLKTVGDVLSIVKWGYRIIQCATPPLLGCLKLAFSSIKNRAIRFVVESCWFQGKAILPLINKFSFFKNLPNDLSNKILKFLRGNLPIQEKYKNILIPLKSYPVSNLKSKDLPCQPKKLSKEQKALLALFKKYGDKKMEKMIQLLKSEDGIKLNMEMVEGIDKALKKVTIKDLDEALKNRNNLKPSVKRTFDDLESEIKYSKLGQDLLESTSTDKFEYRELTNVTNKEIAKGNKSVYNKLTPADDSIFVQASCSQLKGEIIKKGMKLTFRYYKKTGDHSDLKNVCGAAFITANITYISKDQNLFRIMVIKSTPVINGYGVRLSNQVNKKVVSQVDFPNSCKTKLASPAIQPKSKVSHLNDKYEREADVMAERVMRKPVESEGSVMEKTEQEGVQLKCTACEEGIHKKSSATDTADQAPSSLESQINGAKGGGSLLNSSVNRVMSRSFGYDFSHVRIHNNSRAHNFNEQLRSRAFTHGSDIYFNKGEYNSNSSSGKELLAHELTHVVQQNGSTSVGIACQHIEDKLKVVEEDKLKLIHFVDAGGMGLTPLNAINTQLSREFTIKNAKERQAGLLLAFGLLEEDNARYLHQILTHPETKEHKILKARFGMLRRGLRARLTNILATKIGLPLNLQRPGIFGTGRGGQDPYYIVREGITLQQLARYLSDDPGLVDTLTGLNNFAPDQPLKGGTMVTVPIVLAMRSEAKRDIKSDLAEGLFVNRRTKEKVERKRTKLRGFVIPLTEHQVKAIKNNQDLINSDKEDVAREQARATKSTAEQGRAEQEQFKRDLQLFHQIMNKSSQLPFIPKYYLKDDQRWRKIKNPVLRWHAMTAGQAVPSMVSATLSPVVHFVNNGSLFIEGIYEGVRTNLSDDEVNALRKRLDMHPAELVAFIPSFNAGAIVGIGEDLLDLFKALWNIDEILGAIHELLRVMGSYEGAEITHLMGVETGTNYASEINTLANSSTASFGYNLGKLVGPTIVYTILAFLGIQVGLAVVFKKIAKLPKFQRIFSRFKKASPEVGIKPDAPTPSSPKKLGSSTEQQPGDASRPREGTNAPQKLPEKTIGSDSIDTARPVISPSGQLIRLVDTIRERGFNKILALRKRRKQKILGKKRKSTAFQRNGAYGELDFEAPPNVIRQEEIGVAFSGKSPADTLAPTGYYQQYARTVGKGKHPRINDSEVKIFDNAREALLRKSGKEPGVIRIFTERPACGSCEGVAQKFVDEFPHMRVEIYNFSTGKPLLIKSSKKS